MEKKPLELLAPARNLEYGMEAVRCGADALYIGASKFGARYAAGNPVGDIRRLAEYAHLFGVRVYATMNTLLFDDELAEAERQARALQEAGVDGLIVQDMAYATFGLDLALHASTQAAALTKERVRFLQEAGFTRVVLERASSLDEIREVRRHAGVELEAFVHGAICVCYSGQCYLGHALSGRSGNRGVCSQPCRSYYDLVDEAGNILLKNKHLLSLKDLNLTASLGELAEAGVGSFKIEGRLKDLSYLRNTVLHYRRELDRLIARDGRYRRASQGRTAASVEPDLLKSFTRGFTDYYLHGRRAGAASFDTAKAVGERIGTVGRVSRDGFVFAGNALPLHNGDGICFTDANGIFRGTNINKASDGKVGPNRMDGIVPGTVVFRNYDRLFDDSLLAAKVERRLDVRIEACFGKEIVLRAAAENGVTAETAVPNGFEPARQPERAADGFRRQLMKSGETVFAVTDVRTEGEVPFIPPGEANALRRGLLDELARRVAAAYVRPKPSVARTPDAGVEKLDYRANVTNRAARGFYERCGVRTVDPGVELRDSLHGVELMRTKYCVRREIGQCLQKGGRPGRLYLENNGVRLALEFDCRNCEMTIKKD